MNSANDLPDSSRSRFGKFVECDVAGWKIGVEMGPSLESLLGRQRNGTQVLTHRESFDSSKKVGAGDGGKVFVGGTCRHCLAQWIHRRSYLFMNTSICYLTLGMGGGVYLASNYVNFFTIRRNLSRVGCQELQEMLRGFGRRRDISI